MFFVLYESKKLRNNIKRLVDLQMGVNIKPQYFYRGLTTRFFQFNYFFPNNPPSRSPAWL